MQNFLLLPLGLIAFIVPAGLAVYEVEEAEYEVFFDDPVLYHAHLPAPERPEAVFATLGYRPQAVREAQAPVPRRFLASLPGGLDRIERADERKRIFVATLLPLVLRANELIARDRARAELLRARIESGAEIDPLAAEWLVALAERYKLGPVASVEEIDFDALLRRVDIIPPSLALAQGAIESGWGTSRFARLGNAIFGQWTWDPNMPGLVPEQRSAGKRHRVRAFEFLIDSVRGYMHNLNTAPAYSGLRLMRAQLRARNQPLRGLPLASTLIRYSERREAYIADLRTIITSNRLSEFNEARLAPAPLQPLA